MPLIEIKDFENEFSDEERTGIIEAVTDAMVAFTGEGIRPHTWVVLNEVKSGSWGIGGAALGLADVRALQAAGSCLILSFFSVSSRHPRNERERQCSPPSEDLQPSPGRRRHLSRDERGDRWRTDTRRARGGPGREGDTALPPRLQRALQATRGTTNPRDGWRPPRARRGRRGRPGGRTVHAWSNPGEERSVAHVECGPATRASRPRFASYTGSQRTAWWARTACPRPTPAALLLEMGAEGLRAATRCSTGPGLACSGPRSPASTANSSRYP